MSKRFTANGGPFVYEDGNRIGADPAEAAIELARKLNAYQMRVERFKDLLASREAHNESLAKENDRLKEIFAKTERLALVDGAWEAVSVGTFFKMETQIHLLKAETERLIHLLNAAYLENERIRKASEWQPFETAPGYPAKILFGAYFKPQFGNGFWWQHGYKAGAVELEPTHWMPEPQPPNK